MMHSHSFPARQIEATGQHLQSMSAASSADRSSLPLPLVDLADHPSAEARPYQPQDIWFPFSNDASAQYYPELAQRANTPEYESAKNRVAIVIGESSLAAALPYIPEETVLVLDKSASMVGYMQHYVASLRNEDGPAGWGDAMGLNDEDYMWGVERRYQNYLALQLIDWEQQGLHHPLGTTGEHTTDEEYRAAYEAGFTAYKKARAAALGKAIIPWQADITNHDDMEHLGDTLREMDASVTMMNLTNVLTHAHAFPTASGYVDRLEHLPVTPNAPIMTTGGSIVEPRTNLEDQINMFEDSYAVEATGPFFGLDNLRSEGGGVLQYNAGPVAVRPYKLTESKAHDAAITDAHPYPRIQHVNGITVITL